MRRRRRAAITIETDEVVVVRRVGGAPVLTPCFGCGKRVAMVGVDAAAKMAGVSVRTICRWVEAEKVHFRETPGGQLLVCADSLRDL